jgi:hypothetical protein
MRVRVALPDALRAALALPAGRFPRADAFAPDAVGSAAVRPRIALPDALRAALALPAGRFPRADAFAPDAVGSAAARPRAGLPDALRAPLAAPVPVRLADAGLRAVELPAARLDVARRAAGFGLAGRADRGGVRVLVFTGG